MRWDKRGLSKILPVQAMEPNKDKTQIVTISVILLDNSELEFQINKRDRGQVLLDAVFEKVRCKESKYYGLQFPGHLPDCMKWLDPSKSIRKQFKRGYPHLLLYRIKYYIFDINRIKDASTRYQLFLQVKLEILEQRLLCSRATSALLAAYAVQSEIGDFHPEKHQGDYIQKLKFVPNQKQEFENEVRKLHKRNKGLSPVQAELLYLQEAKRLHRYGVDIHHGKGLNGEDIEIGVATDGVGLFKDSESCNKYEWSKIVKISFKRKQFYIQLQKDKVIKDETALIEFTMDNYRACKRLWKNCVDCHSFYRLEKERLHGLYKKQGSNGPAKGEKPVFGFFSMGGKNKGKYDNAEKEVLKFRSPQKSLSSKMLNSTNLISPNPDQELKESRRLSAPPSVTLSVIQDKNVHPNNLSDHDISVTSFGIETAYLNRNGTSQEPAIDLESSEPIESYSDSPFQQTQPEIPPQIPDPYTLPDDIYLIRLKPDHQGRFGFNIKGGNDQSMPITVSKIAQGSPADICNPRLSIGDEILQINGRDSILLTHEQAVHFIRATREQFCGELVLLTKPYTVYQEDDYDAVLPQIIENGPLPSEAEIGINSLEYSMSVLENEFSTGRDMALFDKLYRKKPGLTMKDAKLPSNAPKNRYRDISPYDLTRVKLTTWETDYINGNHIYMEVINTDITNHYIACQGPLHNTAGDFWAMVWEQQATLIVMVTTTVERGMVKCFQYWPSVESTVEYHNISVTSKSEEASSCFIFREFEIASINSEGEVIDKREVSHIQYVAWPDHGVPDDSSDFLRFILYVRQKRIAMTVPTIVHCSAGIGRTGVMIAVETAMCLIEANQPVYPLEITQNMRDQRAMMIQTALQFRFVCEAILRFYKDGIAQPMTSITDTE